MPPISGNENHEVPIATNLLQQSIATNRYYSTATVYCHCVVIGGIT